MRLFLVILLVAWIGLMTVGFSHDVRRWWEHRRDRRDDFRGDRW